MSKRKPKYTVQVAKYQTQKRKIDSQDIMDLDDSVQKEIIQQYEDIRQSGLCNMFNYTDVRYVAQRISADALFSFIKDSMDSYTTILRNFSELMKKFDIKQN